jgi:exosome complex exonuclease RRP6
MELDGTPSSTTKTGGESAARPEHEYVKGQTRPAQDGLDDVFVVRQLGGKRKRSPPAADDGQAQPGASRSDGDLLAAHANIVNIGADEEYAGVGQGVEETARERGRRGMLETAVHNREKKLAKRAREARRERDNNERAIAHEKADGKDGEAEDGEQQEEEEVFDYASAPSMLDRPRDRAGLYKKGRKYDPYGRALDAPKGLGRSQRQKEGRSATFKK